MTTRQYSYRGKLTLISLVALLFSGLANIVVPQQAMSSLTVGTVRELRNSNSGRCLSFIGSNTANGTGANQWDCLGVVQQRWRFEYKPGSQSFSLINEFTGKCLSLDGNDPRGINGNGVHFIEWDCYSGHPNQTFRYTPKADGAFQIFLVASKKCLGVDDSLTANTTTPTINQWTCIEPSHPAQSWFFRDDFGSYNERPRPPTSPPNYITNSEGLSEPEFLMATDGSVVMIGNIQGPSSPDPAIAFKFTLRNLDSGGSSTNSVPTPSFKATGRDFAVSLGGVGYGNVEICGQFVYPAFPAAPALTIPCETIYVDPSFSSPQAATQTQRAYQCSGALGVSATFEFTDNRKRRTDAIYTASFSYCRDGVKVRDPGDANGSCSQVGCGWFATTDGGGRRIAGQEVSIRWPGPTTNPEKKMLSLRAAFTTDEEVNLQVYSTRLLTVVRYLHLVVIETGGLERLCGYDYTNGARAPLDLPTVFAAADTSATSITDQNGKQRVMTCVGAAPGSSGNLIQRKHRY
jgi:hypothetical protein